jgi:restriction system protein
MLGFGPIGSAPVSSLPIKLTRDVSLLMQTVVVLGSHTNEGDLIEAVTVPWRAIARWIEKDPTIMFQLGPRQFEKFIAGWYKKAGFDEVILTPHSGDHGRDVIAVKKGIVCIRIIDSIKKYAPDHLVTANDVRALLGALDENTSKGIVTTSSDFAPNILKDPRIANKIPYRLELINGVELVKRFSKCNTT